MGTEPRIKPSIINPWTGLIGVPTIGLPAENWVMIHLFFYTQYVLFLPVSLPLSPSTLPLPSLLIDSTSLILYYFSLPSLSSHPPLPSRPLPSPPSLTSLSECSRRYCLLGLASISCRITGRYSWRLPALTLPKA